MKHIYYLMAAVMAVIMNGCNSVNGIEDSPEVANTQNVNFDDCKGYGACLPRWKVNANDGTGEVIISFTFNSMSNCNSFSVNYTGTSIGGAWIDTQNDEVRIPGNGYTYILVEVSCDSYDCLCSKRFIVEAGEKPEDMGPIEIGNNCGREYYSHSFECSDGKLRIFCDDSEYDEYDPAKNPFKMVIDSYTVRVHIPGEEDDNSNFPDGGGYVLGEPVELSNIDKGYATVYFYSSECKYPEQHCFYITYNWMDDMSYINDVHVSTISSHPDY